MKGDVNQRRILACLRACEGVSTEELEALAPEVAQLAVAVNWAMGLAARHMRERGMMPLVLVAAEAGDPGVMGIFPMGPCAPEKIKAVFEAALRLWDGQTREEVLWPSS